MKKNSLNATGSDNRRKTDKGFGFSVNSMVPIKNTLSAQIRKKRKISDEESSRETKSTTSNALKSETTDSILNQTQNNNPLLPLEHHENDTTDDIVRGVVEDIMGDRTGITAEEGEEEKDEMENYNKLHNWGTLGFDKVKKISEKEEKITLECLKVSLTRRKSAGPVEKVSFQLISQWIL